MHVPRTAGEKFKIATIQYSCIREIRWVVHQKNQLRYLYWIGLIFPEEFSHPSIQFFFVKKKKFYISIATNCNQVSSNTQSRAIETITQGILLTWSNSLINRVHHSRFLQFCMFRTQIFPHNRDFQQLYHRPWNIKKDVNN